jgi:hypothetical protein
MAQLRPVSIPDIVRDMAGSDPVRRIEDLPPLPAVRSDFDVHGALLDDKVQTNCNALHFAQS